jgi:hypothetical protein
MIYDLRLSCAIGAAFTVMFLIACGNGSHRDDRQFGNPIASCGTLAEERGNTECISIRLAVGHLEGGRNSGRISGSLVAVNTCGSAVALLASPIDVRATASDAWEESLTSVYARLSIYERRTTGRGLEDRGFVVHALPQFVILPAHSTRSFRLEGDSARLTKLESGAVRLVEFCTFAAPVNADVLPTATFFNVGRSIEMHAQGAKSQCPVTLRRSAALVCTPPVGASVSVTDSAQ